MYKADRFKSIPFEFRRNVFNTVSSSNAQFSFWFILSHSLSSFIWVIDSQTPHFINELRIKAIVKHRTIVIVIQIITLLFSEENCWPLKLHSIYPNPACWTSSYKQYQRNLYEVLDCTKPKRTPTQSFSSSVSSSCFLTFPRISLFSISLWTFFHAKIFIWN